MKTKLRGSTLLWNYRDHRDGETATFEVCGLHVSIQDMDGDGSVWNIRKGRRGATIASGSKCSGDDFVECAADAEAALRKIIADRIAELRAFAPRLAA